MNRIGLTGVRVTAEPSVKCGITGTHMRVTVDGEEVEAVQKGEYVYLATNNLPAKKLGEAHTFAVLKGEDTLVSTSASAYSYVLSIIAGGYTGDVLNLVKGLYLYGENTKAALG